MELNLNSQTKVMACIAPVDSTNTTVVGPSSSTGIDCTGYDEALVIVYLGVTAATHTVTCKTSATTNGTYAAITGATMSLVGTDDALAWVGRIKMRNQNPFLRVEIAQSNNAGLHTALVLLSSGSALPETQINTTGTKVFDV